VALTKKKKPRVVWHFGTSRARQAFIQPAQIKPAWQCTDAIAGKTRPNSLSKKIQQSLTDIAVVAAPE
jgi:hypothetical protein